MNRLLITILTLAISMAAIGQDGFSSLEEQMSGKEYKAAGLDKLTPEELAALNDWIRRHSVATLDSPRAGAAVATTSSASAPEDTRGLKAQKDDEDRTPIESRIVGSFSGWDGHAVFKLENGMIWEQDDKDKFYIRPIQNPAVTIKPGLFGSWHLYVEGYNSRCRVERVQ
jgi:hypothetical protein